MGKCNKCGYEGDLFHPTSLTVCKACLAEYQRAYRRRQPKGYWIGVQRKYTLKKRYGLTVEEFHGMIRSQEGRCLLCGLDPTKHEASAFNRRTLHVDHDHRTGRVRGLLCNGCNRAIGLIRKQPGPWLSI